MKRRGIVYLLPSLLGMAVLYLVPIVYTLLLSFVSGGKLGIENYRELFQTEAFRRASVNTIRFMLLAISLQLLFGLHMAKGLDQQARMRGEKWNLSMALLLLPLIVPSGSVATFFQIIFAENGVINGLLVTCGISPVSWFESGWSIVVLLLFYLWKNTPYSMIVLTVGMRAIPQDVLSAAYLDGCNEMRLLLRIKLPLLLPHFFFSILFGVLSVFRVFRQSYLLFGDYPHDSVYMIQNFLNNNFARFNVQRLSAAAIVILSILFFALCLLYLLLSRRSPKNSRKGGAK